MVYKNDEIKPNLPCCSQNLEKWKKQQQNGLQSKKLFSTTILPNFKMKIAPAKWPPIKKSILQNVSKIQFYIRIEPRDFKNDIFFTWCTLLHIVQLLLNKLSNIYLTVSSILHLFHRILVNSLFHLQWVEYIKFCAIEVMSGLVELGRALLS